MKVPTNTVGLPETHMDPAHADTKRITPDCVFGSWGHPRPSPPSAHGMLCITTELNRTKARLALSEGPHSGSQDHSGPQEASAEQHCPRSPLPMVPAWVLTVEVAVEVAFPHELSNDVHGLIQRADGV